MTPLERAQTVLRAARRCAMPTCTSCPTSPTAEQIAEAIAAAVAEEREACLARVEVHREASETCAGIAHREGRSIDCELHSFAVMTCMSMERDIRARGTR